jgi:D-3-phosphoglycerate dehydrogenase
MKALIADKFEKSGIDGLKALGVEVVSNPDATPETLPDLLREHNPDVLVVRSTKVKAPSFDASDNLRLVIRAGAGVDTIDLNAATDRGVYVANCPGMNSSAVAELTWALILSADRRIPDQVAELRDGKWNKKEYSKARGLRGRTLGIVGLGSIGKEVAHIGRAFGMHVVAWSRSLTDAQAKELGVTRAASPLDVAKQSDVVSVNIAANAETKHLVNAAFCDALKPGAIVVNTSRGSVVDEAALLNAIKTKHVRAALDVFENEPGSATGEFTNDLLKQPGVFGTHHVGASTDQAQDAIATETVRIVEVFRKTGAPPQGNAVNTPKNATKPAAV